jgi:hypothetical protein
MNVVPLQRPLRIAAAAALAGLGSLQAQELLLQEGFNTDGTTSNPKRYTVTGGFLSEPPHNTDNVASAPDQVGPVYWARSAGISFVGVPAPTKGRRALVAWDGTLGEGTASADMLKLVGNTVKWLARDKAGASLVFSPNAAAAQGLADYLSSLGYALADDDGTTSDTAYPGDVIIKAPGSATPSRFANATQGVLTFSASDHDDMLTSSIGVTAQFEATDGKIVNSAHPVAAGIPANFTVATGSFNWNLLGDVLPGGAITVATAVRTIPPSVGTLADVDAMAAGTKTSTKASATATELDYSDASAGDWTSDNAVPGGATGLWGLVAKGKLQVKAAGKYSFALGMDDGARLRIDKNRNGLDAADNVIVEDATGAHRARYGDVEFTATGLYDFEVVAFNSSGGGGLEMSVSVQAGGGDTSAVNGGTWELLGQNSGQVVLSGTIAVDSYVPTGADEKVTLPWLVLLNGPQDTPAGSVFGGGPFSGFEGSAFFAASGLNKWNPELIADLGGYRSVQLAPVNVAGKKDVKVTIALAATFLDFETSDFLQLIAYPNGISGASVTLANYSAPSGTAKYFVDVQNGGANRLGLTFLDATYNIPAGATDLVLELRAFTSWWNEIVAFDNIRVTAGSASQPATLTVSRAAEGKVSIAWSGTGGTLQSAAAPNGPYADVQGASSPYLTPASAAAAFYRVRN